MILFEGLDFCGKLYLSVLVERFLICRSKMKWGFRGCGILTSELMERGDVRLHGSLVVFGMGFGKSLVLGFVS